MNYFDNYQEFNRWFLELFRDQGGIITKATAADLLGSYKETITRLVNSNRLNEFCCTLTYDGNRKKS